jgi:phosphate-selective porin
MVLTFAVAALCFPAKGKPMDGGQPPRSPKDRTKTNPPSSVSQISDEEKPPEDSVFGTTGIEVASADGRYRIHLWFRGQFRYTYPFDDASTTAEGFNQPAVSSIDVRRARIKLGGNIYRPWLKYYFEYDFSKNQLLDLRFTLSRYRWLQLRVGQWKVNYNRERVDSSGKQQFVERSIVNGYFTLDRQPGVMVGGHLWPGQRADSWYLFGIFNGNGRGTSNDDAAMMWIARYQWNFLGRDLPYAQSDVELRKKPAGTVAFATSSNTSPYTRFSSAGGGQLEGFEEGVPGQYRLTQFVEETAFKYRGFSLQHEFHWKEVDDNVNNTSTDLRGTYIQVGCFLWGLSQRFPKPLEVAFRYAWVDPDRFVPNDEREEFIVAANWFFAGHDNKLTFDFSRLTLDQPEALRLVDHRIRAQWDISF